MLGLWLGLGIAAGYLCIVSIAYGATQRLGFDDIDSVMYTVVWPITLLYLVLRPISRRLTRLGESIAAWVTTPRVKPSTLPRAVAKEVR